MTPLAKTAALALLLALAGCERTFRDMYDQPRYKPLAASTLWPDGRSSRPPVDAAVAYSAGSAAGASSGRRGVVARSASAPFDASRDGVASLASPPAPSADLSKLERGRERFDIFCAPCHSVVGDGDGMIVRRGFPRPPSFHDDRLRAASDSHFYAVISNGYGAMASYATRVDAQDREAIVAYIRALQFAQHASVDALPPAERAKLETSGGPR